MRRCPACGNSYTDDAKFCAMDATQLQSHEVAHHTLPAFPAVIPGARAGTGQGPPLSVPSTQEETTEVNRGVILAGRYQLHPEFADLPTGQLHEAVDLQGGGRVWVKLVPASAFVSPMLLDRTLRELKQLVRVKAPGVMQVLAQGRTPGSDVYVVFTPAPDGAELLDERLQRKGVLSPDRARAIVLQIGEALAEAQQAGVVHRNVAPHAVYISEPEGREEERDQVLVVDFALAEVSEVGGRIVQGPPHYLAPEQAEGKAVDQRANIYSLGAIYYYLLTGSPPFVGKNTAEVLFQVSSPQQAPAPSLLRPTIPKEIDRIIAKALDKSAARRQLTLRQFLNEVEELGSVVLSQAAAIEVRPYRSATKTMIMGAEVAGPGPVAAPVRQDVLVGPPDAGDRREPIVLSQPPAVRQEEVEIGGGGQARTLIGLPAVVPMPAPAKGAGGAVSPAALAAAFSGAAARPSVVVEAEAVSTPGEEQGTDEEDQATIPMPRMSEAELMATFGLEVPLRTAGPEPAAAAKAEPPPEPLVNPALLVNTARIEREQKGLPVKEAGTVNKGMRETAWFKQGEIEGALGGDPAKSVTVQVTPEDKARLSLQSGQTEQHKKVADKKPLVPGRRMSEKELIDEMRGRSRMIIAVIALLILAGLGLLGWTLVR